MTMGEFAQKMGEAEGISGGEWMTQVMDDMEQDRLREEKSLLDPTRALQAFQEEIENQRSYEQEEREAFPDLDHDEPVYPFDITSVIEVHEAHYDQTFGSQHTKIVATAICSDGKRRRATLTSSRFSGSRWEPPDGESEITFDEA